MRHLTESILSKKTGIYDIKPLSKDSSIDDIELTLNRFGSVAVDVTRRYGPRKKYETMKRTIDAALDTKKVAHATNKMTKTKEYIVIAIPNSIAYYVSITVGVGVTRIERYYYDAAKDGLICTADAVAGHGIDRMIEEISSKLSSI